jgi:hypothetical protein
MIPITLTRLAYLKKIIMMIYRQRNSLLLCAYYVMDLWGLEVVAAVHRFMRKLIPSRLLVGMLFSPKQQHTEYNLHHRSIILLLKLIEGP